MKHILNNISQEEKQRILEQHSGGKTIDTSKFRQLLESKLGNVKPLVMEQVTGDTQTAGGGGEAVAAGSEKTYINEPTFPINKFYGNKGVFVTYNAATGSGTMTVDDGGGSAPRYTLKYTVKCKCDAGDGTGNYTMTYDKSENMERLKTLNVPNIGRYFKEKCNVYLKDKKCAPIIANRNELNALYQRATPADIQQSDRATICKFVKSKQGFTGMDYLSDKQKIMNNFLSNIAFYAPGTDQKVFDNISSQDFSDKGELFCKGWGL